MRYGWIVLSLTMIVRCSTAIAGGSHRVVSNAGSYVVTYATKPATVPFNTFFDLAVDVSKRTHDRAPVTVTVDAIMPAHRHGMNTFPRITQTGPGHFVVTGMRFHMPGQWEMYIDIREGARAERAQIEMLVE